MPVLERHADRTGVKPMYAFNITDDIGRLEANHDLVVEAGGTCVMACVNMIGLAGLEFLSRHSTRADPRPPRDARRIRPIGSGRHRVPRVAAARPALRVPITSTRMGSATSSTKATQRCSTRSPRCGHPSSGSRPPCRCSRRANGAARARDLRGRRHDRSAGPRRRRHPRPPGSARPRGSTSMRAAWESAENGGTADDALAASPALRRAAEVFGRA